MGTDGLSDHGLFKAYQFQKEREIDELRSHVAARDDRIKNLESAIDERVSAIRDVRPTIEALSRHFGEATQTCDASFVKQEE